MERINDMWIALRYTLNKVGSDFLYNHKYLFEIFEKFTLYFSKTLKRQYVKNKEHFRKHKQKDTAMSNLITPHLQIGTTHTNWIYSIRKPESEPREHNRFITLW